MGSIFRSIRFQSYPTHKSQQNDCNRRHLKDLQVEFFHPFWFFSSFRVPAKPKILIVCNDPKNDMQTSDFILIFDRITVINHAKEVPADGKLILKALFYDVGSGIDIMQGPVLII
jgi:hypothetical protein